ncbi:MAG: peptidase M23 [Tateyamaria sp.]
MKTALIPLATLAATPALAHNSAHAHTHGGEASWALLLAAGLILAGLVSGATSLFRVRAK